MSWRIKPDTMAEIRRYVEHRIPPGGFVHAVLANDLYRACAKADDVNRELLCDVADYVESHLPMACRGSHAAVEAWLKGETCPGAALGGGDWGALPGEPCRFCRRAGGVEFLASNHPLDLHAQQARCRLCGRAWQADSPNA